MAGKPTEISSTVPRGTIVAAPVEVTSVVAFLDGSPFPERALPTARWMADRDARGSRELVEGGARRTSRPTSSPLVDQSGQRPEPSRRYR
jgi:hypothetical protein